MENEVNVPQCQEIVDLYWLEKDFDEMTKQIDSYKTYGTMNEYNGATDFFYDLADELEEFQDHVDDWSIFTGIVKEYHMIKADQKEKENTDAKLAKEELLIHFMQQLIDAEILLEEKDDTPEQFVEDYLDSLED